MVVGWPVAYFIILDLLFYNSKFIATHGHVVLKNVKIYDGNRINVISQMSSLE